MYNTIHNNIILYLIDIYRQILSLVRGFAPENNYCIFML